MASRAVSAVAELLVEQIDVYCVGSQLTRYKCKTKDMGQYTITNLITIKLQLHTIQRYDTIYK